MNQQTVFYKIKNMDTGLYKITLGGRTCWRKVGDLYDNNEEAWDDRDKVVERYPELETKIEVIALS